MLCMCVHYCCFYFFSRIEIFVSERWEVIYFTFATRITIDRTSFKENAVNECRVYYLCQNIYVMLPLSDSTHTAFEEV